MRFQNLALLFLLLPGCISVKDITGNSNYAGNQGDYRPGKDYRLLQDACICDFTSPGTLPLFSSTPKFALKPKTFSTATECRSNLGIVNAGTRVRFQEVLLHDYFEEIAVFPVAIILDGPHARMRVDVHDLSRHDSVSTVKVYHEQYFRDPSWLEPVAVQDRPK